MKTRLVQYQGQPTEIAMSDDLASVLGEVSSAQRGRFAYVEAHRSGVNDAACNRPTISDKWFIGNPRYDRYLERKSAAFLPLTLAEVASNVKRETWTKLTGKLTAENATATANKKPITTIEQLFSKAKAELLKSIVTTQAGDRSDGFRTGHDACYATFTGGDVSVSIHLKTEKDNDGHMRPVLGTFGLFEASSIMLPYFLLNRRTIDPGDWRQVDSKALTLMKRSIEEASGVPEWNCLSLGVGNFKSISLNSGTILGKVQDLTAAMQNPMQAAFNAWVRDICQISMDVCELLEAEAACSHVTAKA